MESLERLRAGSARWTNSVLLAQESRALAPAAIDDAVKLAAGALVARAPAGQARFAAAFIAGGYAVARSELATTAPAIDGGDTKARAAALLGSLRDLDLSQVREAAGPVAAKVCESLAGTRVPREFAERAFTIGLGLAVAEAGLDA